MVALIENLSSIPLALDSYFFISFLLMTYIKFYVLAKYGHESRCGPSTSPSNGEVLTSECRGRPSAFGDSPRSRALANLLSCRKDGGFAAISFVLIPVCEMCWPSVMARHYRHNVYLSKQRSVAPRRLAKCNIQRRSCFWLMSEHPKRKKPSSHQAKGYAQI